MSGRQLSSVGSNSPSSNAFSGSEALFRLSQTSLHSPLALTSTQSLVDEGVTHFIEESARLSTFASVLAGGGASRLAKTGILVMGASATGKAGWIVHGLASVGSLGAEVVGFETTNRLTIGLISPIRPLNSWRWNGEGGLRQGFYSSFINFTAFRGAGSSSLGQNIVFRHAAQSSAMVLGHNVAGLLGVIDRPEESLALQFFRAEQMNLELGAGMAALHSVVPGIHGFEKSLDLSNRSRGSGHVTAMPLQEGWDRFSPQTVPEGVRGERRGPSVLFALSKGGGGRKRGKKPPPAPPDLPPEQIEEIVGSWQGVLESRSTLAEAKLEGIIQFLQRTRLGYEVGGEALALKSIDFLREVFLRHENRLSENFPSGVAEILCGDYFLFRNPRLGTALAEAIGEIASQSDSLSAQGHILGFASGLLRISRYRADVDASPVLPLLGRVAEHSDRIGIGRIDRILHHEGLTHPDPSIVRASQELLETIHAGEGMPSIPRTELVRNDPPLPFPNIRPTRPPGEKVPSPRGDYRSAAVALRRFYPLPKILSPHEEVTSYVRYARELLKGGLKENALQAADHLHTLVRKYADASQQVRGLISVGEIRAELGDREGSQAAFSQVLPLIKKVHAYSHATTLSDLWAAQAKAKDPQADETFSKILVSIEVLTPPERPAAYSHFAQKLVGARDLSLARTILDKIPSGYRYFALSELAAMWAELAQIDYHYLPQATLTFREARSELKKTLEVQGKIYYIYGLNRLARALLESGDSFREEGLSLIEEGIAFVRNQTRDNDIQKGSRWEDLIGLLLKAKSFGEAERLIRTDLDSPRSSRSKMLMHLACALARTAKFEKAQAILNDETLFPDDRFLGLLRLTMELEGAGPRRKRAAARALEETRRFILSNEFHSQGSNRPNGLTLLAKHLAQKGEIQEAARMFEEAQSAIMGELGDFKMRQDRLSQLKVEGAITLGLTPLSQDPAPLLKELKKAAGKEDFAQMRWVATLLGFHEEGRKQLLEDLNALPLSTQGWVEAWAYYGASFSPRGEKSRGEVEASLVTILRNSYDSTDPQTVKTFLIAAQALRQIDFPLLQTVFMEQAQERLSLREGTGEPPSIHSSDRVLSQTLSWLALGGTPFAQAFVVQALGLPYLPPEWKPLLERALKRGGHREREKPKVWN